MNIKQNLRDLIKDAYFFQYAGIADKNEELEKKKPCLFFSKMQWLFILFSIGLNLFLTNGFSEDFTGYIISGLSLFVGLFFTFVIMIFDKFQCIDFSKYHYSYNKDNYPIGVRLKNYFKKVTVLSLYVIIISILLIILLSLTLLFTEWLNMPTNLIDFFDNIKLEAKVFHKIIVLAYRMIVFYFLFDFILITLYLVSSIYDFIISEYNKVKLKE